MPQFRKLSPEEVSQLEVRKPVDLEEYTTILKGVSVGEWGALSLGEGEKARVVKRRLTIAAKLLGKSVEYGKGKDDEVVFQVQEAVESTEEKPKRTRKAKTTEQTAA